MRSQSSLFRRHAIPFQVGLYFNNFNLDNPYYIQQPDKYNYTYILNLYNSKIGSAISPTRGRPNHPNIHNFKYCTSKTCSTSKTSDVESRHHHKVFTFPLHYQIKLYWCVPKYQRDISWAHLRICLWILKILSWVFVLNSLALVTWKQAIGDVLKNPNKSVHILAKAIVYTWNGIV